MDALCDSERFGQAFGTMCEIFQHKASPLVIKTYFKTLQEFTIDQVEKAMWSAISQCRFFPKPVELIELITGVSNCIGNKIADSALQQVNIVMEQIRSVGSYGQPVFSDPATKKLMSSRWSWRSVCSMTEVELKWWAKEFSDAYLSFQKNEKQLAIENNELSPRLRLLVGGISK